MIFLIPDFLVVLIGFLVASMRSGVQFTSIGGLKRSNGRFWTHFGKKHPGLRRGLTLNMLFLIVFFGKFRAGTPVKKRNGTAI